MAEANSSRTQDSLSDLFSKERYNPSNHGEKSFRVLYYGAGAAGSVPFLWESQPGTPKHAFNDKPPPPLTPPPYHQSNPNPNPTLPKNNHKKILNSIFPAKATSKKMKNHSWSSSSFSSSSSPARVTKVGSGSSSSVELGGEEETGSYSPTSTLCLGSRKIRGCYFPIKSIVLSIVGHGK